MYAPDIEKHMNDATFWHNLAKVRQDEINELREGLRDKFAMAAMVGFAKGYRRATGYTKGGNVDSCMKLDARLAYGFADAMLEARAEQ